VADCLFCGIVAGEIPSRRVHEDERVVAFHDVSPKAPLHVLVVPRAHVTSVAETADESLLGHVVAVAARVAKDQGYGERGFRIVANAGPDAGMSVPHLHFHVLAGRALGWPPG